MQLLEVIQRSTAYLADRGVESPRLQVELILSHVLNIPRLELYLNFDRALNTEEKDRLREAVRRRGQREPLQYVMGSTSFCGLEIQVKPGVLIPRPETELLVQRAWEWMEAAAKHRENPALPLRVLDWGTGSGCLAVAMAVRFPDARITAVDLSAAALEIAKSNAARHACSDRIEWVESDGCQALPPEARFDLILCNPPYIPEADWAELQPEVKDFEPRMALSAGPDGLDFYRRLSVELRDRMNPGGAVLFEFGDGQSSAISTLLQGAGWMVDEIHSDLSGRERFLLTRRAG